MITCASHEKGPGKQPGPFFVLERKGDYAPGVLAFFHFIAGVVKRVTRVVHGVFHSVAGII